MKNTRMHSSRMRTGRSLTVCCCSSRRGAGGSPWSRGVCLVRGGGSPWSWGGGVLLGSGGGSLEIPPVNRITDTCKKHNLGHNFVAAGNKENGNFAMCRSCNYCLKVHNAHFNHDQFHCLFSIAFHFTYFLFHWFHCLF